MAGGELQADARGDLVRRGDEGKAGVPGECLGLVDEPEALHAGVEGARCGNLIFTNCLGPVFVKNPWWTEDILRDIVLQKHGVARGKAYDLESASFDSCLRFTDTKPEYPIS